MDRPTGRFSIRPPRRQRPDSYRDLFASAANDENERWRDVRIGREQTLKRLDRELRVDMSGPQVDETDDRLTLKNCQRPEVRVVREDHAIFGDGTSKEFRIRGALQARAADIKHIEPRVDQPLHDVRVDVLVGQQTEVSEFHPSTCVVSRTSFLVAAAA